MADLFVRGVDDALVRALKKRAGALPAALLSPPRHNLAELLAAMPDVGVDADFQRLEDQAGARDVFD
jgi:antitoxin FitA